MGNGISFRYLACHAVDHVYKVSIQLSPARRRYTA